MKEAACGRDPTVHVGVASYKSRYRYPVLGLRVVHVCLDECDMSDVRPTAHEPNFTTDRKCCRSGSVGRLPESQNDGTETESSRLNQMGQAHLAEVQCAEILERGKDDPRRGDRAAELRVREADEEVENPRMA